MLARQAVLLAPSKSSCPTQLLSRQHFVRVSPLAATLTKNAGGGLRGGLLIMVNHLLETSHPSFGAEFKYFVLTLLRTLLHFLALFCTQRKLNPLIFKRFRTLSQKHGGCGRVLPLCEQRLPRLCRGAL